MNKKNQTSDDAVKKNQMRVLSLADGFFQSSILFALLKLNIFELIGEENKTLHELSKEVNARPETLARLLNAGVFLKLLVSSDGVKFQVSPDSRTVLLPSAGDNYLGNFLRNLDYVCSAISRLDEAVLKSAPSIDPLSILGADKQHTREFTLAMHNYASLNGKELANFLDTTSCLKLLDLGCGPGTYSFNLGLRNPELEIYLLDLPDILDVAKEINARYPLKNTVHYLPMDAMKDEIPNTYDIILVSNTLHMLGEQASRKLINRLYKSVNKGGSLVIQAHFLRDDHMGARWPIFMDLIQLCVTSEGRNHSKSETKQWMEEAGFMKIEYNPMTIFNNNSFLRGYKL